MKISSFHNFSPTFLLYHPGYRDVVGGILSALRAGKHGTIVRFPGDAIGVLSPQSECNLGSGFFVHSEKGSGMNLVILHIQGYSKCLSEF